jgi:hypothetical protein
VFCSAIVSATGYGAWTRSRSRPGFLQALKARQRSETHRTAQH